MKMMFLFSILALFGGSSRQNTHVSACIYASACITNELDCAVNYSFRWGADSWKKTSLPANMSSTHTYTYLGSSRSSPELYVRFDCDLGFKSSYKDYCLERYQSYTIDCCDARKYSFQKCISYSDYLELYSLPD